MLKNAVNHAIQQPFILATGLAALVHSTWALGTLFSGVQPRIEHITSPIESVWLIGWLLPALLIAFAMDVGQIQTSVLIRERGITIGRGVTFFVFAIGTYYTQWLYIAHHMPALDLADGISAAHQPIALAIRDMAIWFIPALLPLSTLLYTFSSDDKQTTIQNHDSTTSHRALELELSAVSVDSEQDTEPVTTIDTDRLQLVESIHVAECECGWTKEYDNAASVARGLATHKNLHCQLTHSAAKD